MGKHRLIILAIAALVLFSGVAWLIERSNEKIYKGKPLSEWLAGMDYGQPPLVRSNATIAIRELGTNILPRLLSDLDRPRHRLREGMANLGNDLLGKMYINQNRFRFVTFNDRSHRAVQAFWVLGPAGESAAPELMRLSVENPFCLDTFQYMGPGVIPALAKALTDTNQWVRYHAAVVVGSFGPKASEVVPILLINLAETNPTVRREMTNALMKIDPIAAAKTGIN
ncbi:MAG TPA: HEAT repeat domain-containing protein [Verrucomicrobiae bacterium]|jgi:hypothetical protein|nr:HEAT repeat domain-containing protein [Verrucomicrobiae bacterium]